MIAVRRAPYDPLIGAWLLAVCAMLVAMILIGGATRLTDSGLSITEWQPIGGAIPPLSGHDWDVLFAKYRATPQYRLETHGMSLAEFKFIFWWEWSHRFLGRAIGVVFALPFVLFALAGRLKGRFWRCLLLFALGGLQGAIGWWMVDSGLHGNMVVVSPVRLAIHLGLAFFILAFAWRMALGAFTWPRGPGLTGTPGWLGWTFIVLLYVQILAGALMAGSGAGRAYSDWPRIGGEWLPSSYASLTPIWRNFYENHATIQFDHRTLGYVLAAIATMMGAGAGLYGQGSAGRLAVLLFIAALAQAGLGIHAVTSGAPLDISLTHQAGAIVLWLIAHAAMRANAMR